MTVRFRLASFAFVLSFATGTTLRAQQIGPETPLPVDPQVNVGQLANGLSYYIRANERPENRAELRLVVNAGSVLEDEDQRGLAHFVEHMAFNGTTNFEAQELVRYLESIGMRFGPDLNAYTGFDETVYMLTIPTDRPDIVETAFQILEDWATGISFGSEEIEAERGVVIEEWRSRLGAQARLTDLQIPVLLRGSLYADRLPIGLRETLETFPREALVRFYERWYRPDLMAVVAVGDFDPDLVEQLIREHFADLRSVAGDARLVQDVPPHDETLFLVSTDPELTTTQIEVLHKLPPAEAGNVGQYRQALVERLYNVMLNSRFTEITQKPDAPFLGASSSRGQLVRATDVYVLSAVVSDGGEERGLEALLLEAERVAQHGFTAGELERSKLDLLRAFERAFAERERTNSGVYASDYVGHFLGGAPIAGVDFEYQIAQALVPGIQLEEVDGLAREWLTDENRVVLVSAPERVDAPTPSETSLRGVLSRAAQMAVEPYEDTFVDVPLVAEPPAPAEIVSEVYHEAIDLHDWTLANGVRVLLKETDFRDDEIVLTGFRPGGLSLAPEGDFFSASFASNIVQVSGVGPFSAVDLQRALAGKAASASPFIGELEEGLSGGASPSDVETMFQLIYLYFTNPGMDVEAGEAMRDRLRAALANRGANPQAVYSDTLQATLTQNDPRFMTPTLETLGQLDLQVAHEFFRDRFSNAQDFTFVLVGNLDLEGLRPLVQRYLGGLPSSGRADGWRDLGVRPPAGVVEKVVRQGLEPRAQTQLVFTGPLEYTRENRYALRSLADLLELRLLEVLREDMGGTYGVQVSGSSVSRPEARYSLGIGFGASPEQLDALVEVVFEEVERLRTVGPSPDDIARVGEIQRRERETNLRQNGYWIGQIAGYAREGLDFADILTYEELIAGLDADLVQNAARALLRTDNFVRVSLFPAGSP